MSELRTIEECRSFWAEVAKENGWYVEPFYVQVWVNDEGVITDSVSFGGITQDWVVRDSE